MGDTPKIPKARGRTSLSLKKRLSKRLSSPPTSVPDTDSATDLLNSPRVTLNKEANEFTPPHKKLNLDDSFDDSPLSFDGSDSPTAFLSQTFGSNSPDVGWRWTQDDNELRSTNRHTKIDSGFSSNNSSSNMDTKRRRSRSDASHQAYARKRDERRRLKEMALRKAEKARVAALLRERLAKLESEFNSTQTVIEKTEEDSVTDIVKKSPIRTENVFDDFDGVFEDSAINFTESEPEPSNNVKNVSHKDTLDDFFNDSDDGLLVAATQQLESDIPELTQTIPHKPKSETPKKDITTKSSETTTHQTCKEKRSSLYMQFLEDDEDDFFDSLDDSWLQKVSQTNKPRSPFQRYKSMPAATTTSQSTSSTVTTRNTTDNNCDNKTGLPNWNIRKGVASKSSSTSHTIRPIKRHASSHAMTSPSTTNYHTRQLSRRD